MLLAFSAAAQNKWDVAQFDVVKVYLLAVPSYLYYIRYPSGFEEYLAQSTGAEQFNTNAFLLRADKNCYGAADAGRMWYDTLAGFRQETLGFKTSQIDRCVFVRHTYKGNERPTCVILVYAGDLFVFGSTSTVAEVSAELRGRFPRTDGVSDYIGIELKISNDNVQVHQAAYVAKVVAERRPASEDAEQSQRPPPRIIPPRTSTLPRAPIHAPPTRSTSHTPTGSSDIWRRTQCSGCSTPSASSHRHQDRRTPFRAHQYRDTAPL